MKTTVKPVLWPRANRQGKFFIKVRVTRNRKATYISTGYAIADQHWNAKRSEVRMTHPEFRVINATIDQIVAKAKQVEYDLDRADEVVTADRVKREVTGPEAESFLAFAWEHVQGLEAADRHRTAKRTRSVLNKLHDYTRTVMRKSDLYFHDITVAFLRRYEIHLKGLGNAVTTIHSDVKKIRAIYHQAVLEQVVPPNKNPFAIFRSQFKAPKKSKTKLTADEIHQFKTVELPLHSYHWHVRNLFMFSFYCGGLRIGDILGLRWYNVRKGRLVYDMEKTDKDRSVFLLPQAHAILDQYRDDDVEAADFIFPILDPDKDYTSAKITATEKEVKTAIVNKYLKQIAEKAGITSKITSHTARHSAADYLRREGVSVYDISKILGHSKISTTEVYLASLDVDSMDGALGKLGSI